MNKDSDVQKNTELEEQIQELENNWKRALADYKNLEKRVAEEKEGIVSFSNLVLISELIPVLDNLEMLEKHIDDIGLKLVVKEFKQIAK
jgi:molecular chaperone GrpE